MGADAPADNIVAIIVSVLGALGFPLTLPFTHRFGRRTLSKGVAFMSVVTTLSMAFYATLEPFDEMHQKRLFIIHSENVRSVAACRSERKGVDGFDTW